MKRVQVPLKYTLITGASYNGIARCSLDEIENYTEIAPLFQYIKFTKIVTRVTWTNPSGGSVRYNSLNSIGVSEIGAANSLMYPFMRIYHTPVTETFALSGTQIDEMRSVRSFYMKPGVSYKIVSTRLQCVNEITANATGAATTAYVGKRAGWLPTAQPGIHVWGNAFLIVSEQTNNASDPDYMITVHRDVYFRVKGLK